MRLWSLHPKYLDSKGLVALWRVALLAKKVLEEMTNGYKNHPQLIRFKLSDKPLESINQYLAEIFYEAEIRKYNFDKNKINWNFNPAHLIVTNGQLNYEFQHLLNKPKKRDAEKYRIIKQIKIIEHHPIFKLVAGDMENWEIRK